SAFVLILLAGCSSNNATPPDGSSDTVDAPKSDGHVGSPDAPQLTGKACPSSISEIGRIAGANVRPDDRGFYGATYKQGLYTRDADGDTKADVLAVEYVS